MMSGISAQVTGKVDLDTIFGGAGTNIVESDFRTKESHSKGKDSKLAVMEQHTTERDFSQSRLIIEAIKKLKVQQDSNFLNRQTYEEFIDDPFGEKRRMQRAGVLDEETKNQMFVNQVKLKKTKELAESIGLDANAGLFGRKKEFESDERFQALFKRKDQDNEA